MGRMLTFEGPRKVGLREYEEPPLRSHEVRLRTLYSGISAGTELTAYRGSNPYLSKQWDADRRLFLDVDGQVSLQHPIEGWGYEEVGEVVEVGSEVVEVRTGEIIWGTWGHKSTTVVKEDEAAKRKLPSGVDPMLGIFSRIGAIALNAVLDADVHLGEYVAVFGQGVPGQIAAQLARLNGGTIIAVDGIPKRLELAEALGAAHIINFTKQSAAEEIKRLTGNLGADVSIEISGSYRALHEAIRATAYNSKVISSGFYQGEGIGLSLGEEFHHNRIQIACSQIFGVNPSTDHRWTVERLERTVMNLAAEEKIDLKSLVTQVLAVDEAEDAFRLLDEDPTKAIQVVLSFEEGT